MGKKFVASYSGGKDSVLAIYRAIQQGHTPVAAIITYNTDRQRSWFHGIPQSVLASVSEAFGFPIRLVTTTGEAYAQSFRQALAQAREEGAELCVFGDIDIEAHHQWCSQQCEAVGMEAFFPLWGESRRSLVSQFVDCGFTANFTIVDTTRMSDRYLGRKLTHDIINQLEAEGVDACGENGEYHTFVSAGPLFRQPVAFTFGEKLVEGHHALLPVLPVEA